MVRLQETICRTHERAVHRVRGLGPAEIAGIIALEHGRLAPGDVARALRQWGAAASHGWAYRPGSVPCGAQECCGPGSRAILEDALRHLPRRGRPGLLRLVERADEAYLRNTMPDPLADPGAPWWERRRPAGWPRPGRPATDRAGSIRPEPAAVSPASPPLDQMSFTWALPRSTRGWAECTVGDQFASARMPASDVGCGPEHLLRAVTAILLGADSVETELSAEPACYRWLLRRDGHSAGIQILMLPDGGLPDNAGTVIWSSCQRTDVLRHAIMSGFDQLARELGEEDYQRGWGHPFPRAELEALRKAPPSPTR